jgi:myo-inositol-1(or 4)-monophosphatase
VTEGDERVEEFVIRSLQKQFPDHGFDSEERGKENVEAEYVWTLDPIDGTRYYADGVPLWAVSLALARGGEPVLAVVYSPKLRQMYSAVSGQGAALNGRKIECAARKELSQRSVCLEIPGRGAPPEELRWAMDKMRVLVENTYRTRILGVGSLSLCFCAAGGFDAYVNLGSALKRYDIAAGRVILEAAGGKYRKYVPGRMEEGGESLPDSERDNHIVAGRADLCDEICKLLGVRS